MGLPLAAGLLGLLLAATGCAPRAEGPNIVLVILDTLRDDYTGAGGSRERLTENLDGLAAESTIFASAWANAPWTVPSHASFLTGLLPSEHGCMGTSLRFDPSVETAAGLLARAGYETTAFYSNSWLSQRASDALRGFENHRQAPLTGAPDDPGSYYGDQGGRVTNRNIESWLADRESRQPFFALINYLEPHLPFSPSPSFRDKKVRGKLPVDLIRLQTAFEYNAGAREHDSMDWTTIRRLYGGDIYDTDQLLGELLDLLGEHELLDETVLIVTSDHGENLGEHQLMDHQFSVHESLLAVPLVIHAPGRLAGGVRDDPVMLTDLFATILDAAGVEPSHPPRFSRSLLGAEPASPAPPPTRAVIAEYAGAPVKLLEMLRSFNAELDDERLAPGYRTVRVGELRLTLGSDGSRALHDLAADPTQSHDLALERPEDVRRLRDVLDELALGALPTERGASNLDAEVREELESLGYVQ